MPNLIARAKRLAQTNAAAMLLLRVCYWSKKQGPTRMDAAVWAEEVGLSLAEFKAAKQQLKKLGLITAEVTPGALLNTCLGLSAEGAQKFNAPFVPSVGCARGGTWYTAIVARFMELYRASRTHYAGRRWVAMSGKGWAEKLELTKEEVAEELRKLVEMGLLVVEAHPYKDRRRVAARPTDNLKFRLKLLSEEDN